MLNIRSARDAIPASVPVTEYDRSRARDKNAGERASRIDTRLGDENTEKNAASRLNRKDKEMQDLETEDSRVVPDFL